MTDTPAPAAAPTSAPFWRRLLAIVYDLLCLIGIWFVVGAVAVWLHRGQAIEHSAPFSLLLLIAGCAYFAFSWRRGGQTLGMKCWRIRVVDAQTGGRLAWRQALVRCGVALLSWLPLGLGYWWALVGARRAWHDLASASRLVRA